MQIKGYPPDPSTIHGYGPGYWIEQFEQDKIKITREFEDRLLHLKENEARIRGDVSIRNMEIVTLLRQIAHWTGVPRKKHVLQSMPPDLANDFSAEQKLILFRWLNEIFENTNRRWKAFHFKHTG